MKREYSSPRLVAERFEANEYVATCGKTPTGEYIFKCDAPGGTLYYYRNNTRAGGWSSYHDCGKTHTTNGTSGYREGFVDRNKNGREDSGEHVLVWLEYDRWGDISDAHASKSLTMGEIDVERS